MMNNCGRASFNATYDHVELRNPTNNSIVKGIVGNSNSPSSRLSVDAPVFIPTFNKSPSPAAAHMYQQQMQHQQQLQQQLQQQQQQQQQQMQQSQHYLNNIQQNNHLNNHHQQQQQQHLNHHQQHHHQQQQSQQIHNNHHQYQNSSNQRRPKPSVQERLQFSRGSSQQHQNNQQSGSGGNTMIEQQKSNENGTDSENREEYKHTESELYALTFLEEVMKKINADPGKFENYQKDLTSLYLEYTQNNFVLSNAIEIIFEQAINEPNFRYMGAKICRLLDAIDPAPTSTFRQLLTLKMKFHQNEIHQYLANEQHKVRGTTLFLAELYIQLQNDGSRLTTIAESISQSIFLLLQKTSPENVKCICQTLKLCGYELEIDLPKYSEEIIGRLRGVGNLDVSTERLLNNVLELSGKRWGRSNEPSTVMTTPSFVTDPSQEFKNEPVFYGPDGQILTEEESSFLSNYAPADGVEDLDDLDDNDPDALVDPEPEMDPEIQRLFKDFVKIDSQNKHKY